MFAELKRQLNDLQRSEIKRIVMGIVKDSEEIITAYNKQQLQDTGKNSFGVKLSDIGGEYSPFTIEIRKKKGKQTKHVDLFDKGNFQGDFYIDIKSDSAVIDSKDSKRDELVERWGIELFGVNNENKQDFIDQILLPNLLIKLNLLIKR